MWLVPWLVGKELSVELDYGIAHTHTPSRFSRRGGHVESWYTPTAFEISHSSTIVLQTTFSFSLSLAK